MLVTLPVHRGDCIEQLRLLEWIEHLGSCAGHSAVIVADADTPAAALFKSLAVARRVFDQADFVFTKAPVKGWPQGPNELFLLAAETAALHPSKAPWLFLEPDAIPLKAGWLNALAEAYAKSGSLFLGSIIPCDLPGYPQVYLNGVAIYPANAASMVSDAVRASNDAFDLTVSKSVLRHSRNTELIQHLWGEFKAPPIFREEGVPGTNIFSLKFVRKDAVLFHRDKTQSLIPLLRGSVVNARQRTFVQLGRFGDIILLLPALKYIFDTTGHRPRLICSTEYASVLEGVSYVEPVPLNVHWWTGMPEARAFGERTFGEACVLQCYAANWGINLDQWPNFMTSMHDRTGVPLSLFNKLPLVFDRRSPEREAAAVNRITKKPFVLLNCLGFSSPFPYKPHILTALFSLRDKVNIVDMSQVKLHRIFDLLGLMDAAAGTITIDTATLHLAHGSKRPYVAFTIDGWSSSFPRGNCALNVKYSQALQRLPEVVKTVQSWI